MKRALFLILILVCYFQSIQGIIESTLTRTNAELTAITTEVGSNAFLIDTNNVTGGQLSRNDMDATRDPDYQLFKDLKGMAGNLQKAIFAIPPDNPQTYINYILSGQHPAYPTPSNPEYNGLNDLDFDEITGPEDMFDYFMHNDPACSSSERMLYFCYVVNYAISLFDAMYYYNDAVDSFNNPYQSVEYVQNLDNLRRIIESGTDLMYYIKTKYDSLCVNSSGDTARKYYWGLHPDSSSVPDFYDDIHNTDVFLPRFYLIQDRLMASTAWGYGAQILRKDAQIRGDIVTENKMNLYLGIVDSLLTESSLLNYPPYVTSNYPKTGLLDFHTSKSGAYLESPGYFNWVMLWSNQFFSTSARLGGINYYNNDYIKGWIKNTIEKTTPYKADWAYDDSNNYGYGYIRHRENTIYTDINAINSTIASCYYYTNDLTLQFDCSWYINSRVENGYYPGISEYTPYFNYCLLYFSNPSNLLIDNGSLPESYINGSWAGNEFSVLRPQINSTDNLVEKPAMYITYQNSMNCPHNHADQTSYSFFYRGKQFFIDPGYHNTTRQTNPLGETISNWEYTRPWLQSPYAHNMIVVNPMVSNELLELNDCYIDYDPDHSYHITGQENYDTQTYAYKPSCELKYSSPAIDNHMYDSPSYKTYFNQNGETDILKTFLKYDYEAFTNPFHVDLNRTFIRDGNLFFIYDDLVPSDSTSRTYWNLIQPGFNNNTVTIKTSDNTDAGLYHNSTYQNIFDLTKGELSAGCTRDRIDFSIGSTMPASINPINIDYNASNVVGQYCLPTDDIILERTGLESSYGDISSPNGSGGGINHARIRCVASGTNPKFLTVIAPRDAYYDPQLITETITAPAGHYGTRISSKSHSDPAIVCTTYCGCSDGDELTDNYGNGASINTDSKFYLVTKPTTHANDSYVDNSLVLIDGNYLNINEISIYRGYSDNIESISASYLNNSLHLVFKADDEDCPRFKISRSGVLPQHFSVSLHYSTPVIPPTEPDIRADVIQFLAYDEDYFYVNYKINDLINDNLISPNLTIYKGNYICYPNWTILNFNGPEIILTGDWTIPLESRINITGNSSITLSPDFNIAVDGILSITGMSDGSKCSLTSLDDSNWGQIIVNSCGRLEMQYANIEKATVIQSRGKLDIRNVTINNCQAGIMLISRADGWIEDTVISNCDGYGLVLQNCLPDAYRSRFSKLHFNNNKYGIFLYNSSPIIDSIMVVNNDEVGVLCMRNSNPYITRSAFSDTYIHLDDTERPEFTLYQSCYPILEKNDIIFGDGYSLFSYDPNPHPYACPNNYWGTIDESIIAQSFYPTEWSVDFIPFLTDSFHSAGNQNLVASYFEQALGFEKNNELATARLMYKTIIVTYPTSEVAMAAASRLVCIAVTEEELILAKNYLEGIYDQYPSTKLAETARLDYLVCQRLLEEYSEAIAGYQDLLENCSTYIDSLLTQLDIIYTYLEAESNGNKALTETVMCMGEPLISTKRAKELESQILGVLLNQPYPGEVTYHVPDYIVVTDNYPNPFNPTTTIRFSIPKSSDCELIIYNVKGQAVKHLMSETKERGIYHLIWDSKDDNGSLIGSGVYFYRLRIDGLATTKKMLLLK